MWSECEGVVCTRLGIGGGTRGAEGATAPPDFKIYAFGPPQIIIQEINLHQLGIVLTHLYLVSLVQPV